MDVPGIDPLVLTVQLAPCRERTHDMYGPLYGPLTIQAPLHIETMRMTERGMTLDVAVTTPQAHCPSCTQPSTHVIVTIGGPWRICRGDHPRAAAAAGPPVLVCDPVLWASDVHRACP